MESFDNTPPLLMVSVRDDGPGIPPETLPKIFEAYFSTKGARQGTGLGLNIVQRLIKEARGALHVHTQVGQGTSFTVYLPAVPLASNYRLVDIPISNCLNSGFNQIFVLTQFNTASLHKHIQQTYKFDGFGLRQHGCVQRW